MVEWSSVATVFIDSLGTSQLSIKNRGMGLMIQCKPPFSYNTKDAPLHKMIHLGNDVRATLYLDEASGVSKKKVRLPFNAIISIGRRPSKRRFGVGCSTYKITEI